MMLKSTLSKKDKMINDNNSSEWRLTIKELKESKGFEDISDEDGERVIDTLVQLCLISYNVDYEGF